VEVRPAALKAKAAGAYLGGFSARWMEDATWIPRTDMRKPGAKLPLWVWRVADLDEALAKRVIQPGQTSPFGEG
jgi:hypothetical protein